MSLLDQILDQISEPRQTDTQAERPGVMSLLTPLLGGDEGIAGLVDRFQAAGLGHIVDSWISNRPNLPVNPGQLRDVLGEEQTRQMAAQSGLSVETLLSQLSRHLPELVDRMTPKSTVPPSQ